MAVSNIMPKNIYILAGPNGAGKTTFAKVLLPQILQIKDFVNADLIAAGLNNFHKLYKSKVNLWMFFDNSSEKAVLLDKGENSI